VINARRSLAVALSAAASCAVLVVSTAAPAIALTRRDDGDEPGELISLSLALGLFIGIPALVFAVLAALIYLPSMRSPKTPLESSREVEVRTGHDAATLSQSAPNVRAGAGADVRSGSSVTGVSDPL
jgi:hypothetical protein